MSVSPRNFELLNGSSCWQVKTDLVLRGLRDAGGVLVGPAAVSYNALVDKYFPQPPSESESTPLELHR